MAEKELDLLMQTHDASGSSAVADALRFAQGQTDARDDVEATLRRMALVDVRDQAACVRDYMQRAAPPMPSASSGAPEPASVATENVANCTERIA